jgi:hypothetical protein
MKLIINSADKSEERDIPTTHPLHAIVTANGWPEVLKVNEDFFTISEWEGLYSAEYYQTKGFVL